MKEDILSAVMTSPAGRLKQLEGKFVYMPNEIYCRDEFGNILRTGYVCSYIAAARKYGADKINMSLVALDKDYDGSPIDANDGRIWNHETLSMANLGKLDVRGSFEDFIKE